MISRDPKDLVGTHKILYDLTRYFKDEGDSLFLTNNYSSHQTEVYRAVTRLKDGFLKVIITYKRGSDDIEKYLDIIHKLDTGEEMAIIYANGVLYNE